MSGAGHNLQPAVMPTERINQILHLFGESVRRFFREQKRSQMVSPLFNLPGRLVLGSYCYFEHLGELLPLLTARATPEEIGRSMKRVCSRPNYVHLHTVMLGYLNGREQARLAGSSRADRPAELSLIFDFWTRVAEAYRNDGLWLQDQSGFTFPLLPETDVQLLASSVRNNFTPAERHALRRMMATLELFTFILNGEARVGVCHHGPYPLENGDVLLVKELIGLREDFYPWARLKTQLPVDRVARVMRLRGANARIVLFGSLRVEPTDFDGCIVAEEYFALERGKLRPIPAEEAARLTALAADAQMELYRELLTWDDRYRIEYGAELYACLLKSFAEPLGFAEEFGAAIRRAFRSSIDLHLEDLASGREQPLVLQHIAATDGPIYAPCAAS